jgi:glycosyltransferase involved in cell wall biosynthesis
MKIAMISTPFISVPPATYGGTELVVHELVEGLVEEGHEVTLFATGDSRTRADLRFLFPRSQWPPEALTELNHVSWAMQEVASGDFDLIHAHTALALGMSRLLPAPPLIYTIHHTRTPEFSDLYRYFPDVEYIAISHNQRKLEVPLPRCEVVHHGLDPRRFETGDVHDYVCFVARLSEIKGPHIAIDVAAEAGVSIRVAGEAHPPDREFFQREMEGRLGLSHVTYLGSIGEAGKRPLLKHARALLVPIEWDEPFGLILIEAMLSGCPVVAFPRGSVPELVEPGVTGFVVESPEEMAAAIRPGGCVDSFDRLRCRHRAMERFSRDRLVKEHLQLYQNVVARSAAAGLS